MSSFLLDIDRASSVFALLFAFIRDEACSHEELYTFDEALNEILLGVKIPEEAREKLERIYKRSVVQRPSFSKLVDQVAEEFEDERETLVSLVKIILRIVVEDGHGMLSRRDRERIRDVVHAFDLSLSELRSLSAVENQLISFIAQEETTYHHSGQQAASCSEELRKQYQVLGCSPEASDRELKQAYRKLAMTYHPDHRTASRSQPHPNSTARFRQIQTAFQAIQRNRSRP